MQRASKSYKQAMKKPLRNRAYIKATIGIINSIAQKNIQVSKDGSNDLSYLSNLTDAFNGIVVDKPYATMENDFSKVDNTMFFPPKNKADVRYSNGIISKALCGFIKVDFQGENGLDIKGLTIDFGDCFPTKLTISNDNTVREYTNDTRYFRTEDVFDNTSFITIKADTMVNVKGRLRIYSFQCGIVNVLTDSQVKSYSFKDNVSSICDSIPSQDMTLTVDNQNLYYNVDNPESAIGYLEQGQEIHVTLGYEIDDYGTIEWIKENVCYLKSWNSTHLEAKFTAVDIFDYKLQDKYYRGMYRENGISLYDLAVDVFTDAHIEETDYFIDPYLKNEIVYNPMPVVSHREALQIIANAGRCTLSIDRDEKIHIQSSFIPKDSLSVNNKTDFSMIKDLTKDIEKQDYAMCSLDYSAVDDTMYFLPL